MSNINQSVEEQLQFFFEELKEIRSQKTVIRRAAWLSDFFNKLNYCPRQVRATPIVPRLIESKRLECFFVEITKPLEVSRYGARRSFDPLSVVGLGRDEIRVVSVLAWLLNPYESHNFGSALLEKGLLALVNQSFTGGFPVIIEKYCQVRTEINPGGDIGDRVDIEINAKNFYILIEAKIDAVEQEKQIERYCGQASARAIGRPWAVVFLTPDGRNPREAGVHTDCKNIACISWKIVSKNLKKELMKQIKLRKNAFHCVSRQSAEFFSDCYLEYINSL